MPHTSTVPRTLETVAVARSFLQHNTICSKFASCNGLFLLLVVAYKSSVEIKAMTDKKKGFKKQLNALSICRRRRKTWALFLYYFKPSLRKPVMTFLSTLILMLLWFCLFYSCCKLVLVYLLYGCSGHYDWHGIRTTFRVS